MDSHISNVPKYVLDLVLAIKYSLPLYTASGPNQLMDEFYILLFLCVFQIFLFLLKFFFLFELPKRNNLRKSVQQLDK